MILNKKGILQQFDLVVYPVQIVFALGDMEKEINRLYKPYDEDFNYIGRPQDNPAATYNVKTRKEGDACCLIWLPNTNEVRGSYLSHEAGHAALEIFRYVGAKVDFENQEPYCYLQSAIFRLCNSAFYKWKESNERAS